MSGLAPDHATGLQWRIADMTDQTDRTVVVTGTSIGGLGYQAALQLARHGARVVLAGRSLEKLATSRAAVLAEVPQARLEQFRVDLADLSSVRRAGEEAARLGPIDCLVNNAGVMAPAYRRTPDGIELQMATNHIGPFLLTGLLMPLLVASGDGRVVSVSSTFHRMARSAPLGDPRQPGRRYLRWGVYAQSKLANLLFTRELDRRCRASELPVRALAAHPGFAGTHLAANGQYGRSSGGIASILDGAVRVISQSAEAGSWPLLMAATVDLPGNTYCGPSGPGELAGPPKVVGRSKLARDDQAARRLWEVSEAAVSLSWP